MNDLKYYDIKNTIPSLTNKELKKLLTEIKHELHLSNLAIKEGFE